MRTAIAQTSLGMPTWLFSNNINRPRRIITNKIIAVSRQQGFLFQSDSILFACTLELVVIFRDATHIMLETPNQHQTKICPKAYLRRAEHVQLVNEQSLSK